MNSVDVVKLSDEERGRRQAAVDYARASMMLEGFTLSPELERQALAFVNGDMTLVEFVCWDGL